MTNNNIINFNNMKHSNRLLVLNMLLRNGKMSRADIARELKCDGTTITHIVRELLKKDLVKSAGIAEIPGGGRPKELITLNPDSRQAIGISLEPPYITGIITGLTGKISFCEKVYLGKDIAHEELINILKKLGNNLVSRTEEGKLLGIGIATFGVFSPEQHKVIASKFFPAIENLNFMDLFRKEFGIEPEIIDNSYAKALTEINLSEPGGKSTKNFMLLDLGTGIALVNVCAGIPILGPGGYIGEFGHTLVNSGGEKCHCGRTGCLEMLCSMPVLEKGVSEASGEKNISFEKIVSLYQKGERKVAGIIDKSAEVLGAAVGNMLTALPTDEIIFTGRLMELGDKYFAVLEKSIRSTAFPLFVEKTRISKSRAPDENGALGACSVVLKSFFDGQDVE
jgi:predicted NBD/HSP70 family sugar kinase